MHKLTAVALVLACWAGVNHKTRLPPPTTAAVGVKKNLEQNPNTEAAPAV